MTAKKAAARYPGAGANEVAVRSLLDGIKADSALAQLAITLAKSLDEGVGITTAAVARELRATLTEIREGAAASDDKTSKADELRARRAARISAAKDSERPAVADKRGS